MLDILVLVGSIEQGSDAADVAKNISDALTTFLGGVGGVLLLLVPGFIIGKILSRGVRGPELGDKEFIAATGIGGIVTHVIALFWTINLAEGLVRDWEASPGFTTAHYLEVGAWSIIVLLVLPIALASLFAWMASPRSGLIHRLLDAVGLSSLARTPAAWNYKFQTMQDSGERGWLRVQLKDGGAFLGQYAGDARASTDPSVRDLYLSRTWDLDENGTPRAETNANRGVWISGEQIKSIEFFDLD